MILTGVIAGEVSHGGGGGISFLTNIGASAGGGSSPLTTSAIDTTGANFLVAVLAGYYSGSTVSDSKGNSWQVLTQYGTSGDYVTIVYSYNPTVGTGHTFTITNTGGGGYIGIMVAAFSGLNATSAVFESGTDMGSTISGASTGQPGSITPATTGDLVITGLSQYNTATMSVNDSFTLVSPVGTSGGQSAGLAYLIVPNTSALNPTWTSGNSAAIDIAAFAQA